MKAIDWKKSESTVFPASLLVYKDYAYVRKNVMEEVRENEDGTSTTFFVYEECITDIKTAINLLNGFLDETKEQANIVSTSLEEIMEDIIPTQSASIEEVEATLTDLLENVLPSMSN